MCCREILYREDDDGKFEVTGLRIGKGPSTSETQADVYIAALDLPGAQRVVPPAWRRLKTFDDIYKLSGVPVVTVQLRYGTSVPQGWVRACVRAWRDRGRGYCLYGSLVACQQMTAAHCAGSGSVLCMTGVRVQQPATTECTGLC